MDLHELIVTTITCLSEMAWQGRTEVTWKISVSYRNL